MKKSIVITQVQKIKEGINPKTGKKWELFRVFDENGESYFTFSTAYQKLIGQKMEIEYKIQKSVGKNGIIYVSKYIVERSQTQKNFEKVFDCLKVINDNIKKLAEKVEELNKITKDMLAKEGEEIKEEKEDRSEEFSESEEISDQDIAEALK
jgi:hypothetical protein